MYRERQRGLTYSAVIHFMALILAIFGLPSFLQSDPPIEPAALTVEILPISTVTNVRPSPTPPTPEEKPKEKEKEVAKPSPPVKTTEPTPPPPTPEAVVPKPKDKADEKKPEPKKEEKKNKAKEEDLAAILKAVKDTAQKEKKDKTPDKADTTSKSKSMSNQFDPTMQLSMSEKDAIMSQIAKCWSVPAGAKDAHQLVVLVNAEFNADGSYIKVELASSERARYSSDTFFRAAADAAIRAVKQCSPLTGLPADRYNGWRSLELRFDPKFMLN